MDFSGLDGWSMYHGDVVPGFPQHPHRGFETVTVVRRGLLDHSDSLGATARYGHGDVQWLTTGSGILHAEMFPLLSEEQPNPVELFQLWLNLPSVDKFAEPHFSMFWSDSVPKVEQTDEQGRRARVTIIAGAWGHIKAPAPPPRSWAAHADSDVAIWTLQLDSGASFILPAAQKGSRRMLYVFRGDGVDIDGGNYAGGQALELRGDHETSVLASSSDLELLLLQGRPIGEPVVKRGPFVMNSEQEIEQAYADFRRTRFGGWPWRRPDPVHEKEGRFAKHADGRLERPV
jgi:redox-sensitive bicupin YhaK (pirin superfamily)